jgi:HEAT repeat protein
MDTVKRIADLLKDPSPEKRIAASVVLGELKEKDPHVISGLCEMARDPVEAFSSAAVRALGEIGSMKALPALLDALEHGGETERLAGKAIASLGAGALPAIKDRLAKATPEVRAALSQVLPALGGKQSFELALQGLHDQTYEAANRVALSIRHELKGASDADKKAMRSQVEKFLGLKRTRENEVATRSALKILGFLEVPEVAETLLGYLGAKQPSAIRAEAATSLRFALGEKPTKKAINRLVEMLEDEDPIVSRAARDTLTTLKFGPELADELDLLTRSKDAEVGRWAIGRLGELGGKAAAKALVPIAAGPDRARAQVAAKAIAALPDGVTLLCDALVNAREEVGAQVLAETLFPLAKSLGKKDLARLSKAGIAALKASAGLGRRKLDPVREADPQSWATAVRKQALTFAKREPGKAISLYGSLSRSPMAEPDDRYSLATLQLARSPKNPHPKARAQDPAIGELERLATNGFPLAKRLLKDGAVTDEGRLYVAFHFAEKPGFKEQSVGVALLEALASKGAKNKFAKAAKNKLALLGE